MSTMHDSRCWPHTSKAPMHDKIQTINNFPREPLVIKCTLTQPVDYMIIYILMFK
jgi:hypothetical protein